jgi:hypothetical protein
VFIGPVFIGAIVQRELVGNYIGRRESLSSNASDAIKHLFEGRQKAKVKGQKS